MTAEQASVPAIDWREIMSCASCSEKWGVCGFHMEKFKVYWQGRRVEQERDK